MKRAKTEYEVPRFAIHMAREGSPVRVSTPEAAAEVARQICCADAATETFVVMFLDGRNNVRGATIVAQGSSNSVHVSLTQILRAAVVAGHPGFIVAHNHPSGIAAPSAEDDHVTRSVAEGAKAVGVQFIDHVIVTECGHAYSYLDKCPGALKA